MNKEQIQAYRDFLQKHVVEPSAKEFAQDAADFVMLVIDTINIWDDIYDGDLVVEADLNRSYVNLFHDLQLNRFYQQYAPPLQAMIVMLYLKWHTANIYESEKRSIEKAYMLRAELYGLIHYVIVLTRGIRAAEMLATTVWDAYNETLSDLIAEVQDA